MDVILHWPGLRIAAIEEPALYCPDCDGREFGADDF